MDNVERTVALASTGSTLDSKISRANNTTLTSGVIVGSGAQVLGPITVGRCARVGANAVATKDVPSGTTVVGIPAKSVRSRAADQEGEAKFVAYGTPTGEGSDPVSRAIEGLLDEVQSLRARVNDLERDGQADAGVDALGVEAEDGAGEADQPAGKC